VAELLLCLFVRLVVEQSAVLTAGHRLSPDHLHATLCSHLT